MHGVCSANLGGPLYPILKLLELENHRLKQFFFLQTTFQHHPLTDRRVFLEVVFYNLSH
jgi:hypothetical protein